MCVYPSLVVVDIIVVVFNISPSLLLPKTTSPRIQTFSKEELHVVNGVMMHPLLTWRGSSHAVAMQCSATRYGLPCRRSLLGSVLLHSELHLFNTYSFSRTFTATTSSPVCPWHYYFQGHPSSCSELQDQDLCSCTYQLRVT